jgi:hypothetical protein
LLDELTKFAYPCCPRPIPIVRELLRQAQLNPEATHPTYNAAFLAPEFIQAIRERYDEEEER